MPASTMLVIETTGHTEGGKAEIGSSGVAACQYCEGLVGSRHVST